MRVARLARQLLITGASAVMVVAGSVGAAPAAEAAASTQRICNSKNSVGTISVEDTYGNQWTLGRSKCVAAAAKPTYVYIGNASYRVGYNLGPYSDCRYGGRGFTPYQKAETIYFRTYNDSFCDS